MPVWSGLRPGIDIILERAAPYDCRIPLDRIRYISGEFLRGKLHSKHQGRDI